MQASLLNIFSFGGCKLLREQISERGLDEWAFHFVVWNLVSQLALFCTSNVQLIEDVYNHRFWCRFKKHWYFLDVSAVCSELFADLKLAVGLLNICTLNVISVWKPETQFWCEFATEWLLQEILLLANVKLWIAVSPLFGLCRQGSNIFRLRSEVWIWNFLMSISWNRSFFRMSLSSKGCLIYVQLFSQRFCTRPQLYLWYIVALAEIKPRLLRHARGGAFWERLGFKVTWE